MHERNVAMQEPTPTQSTPTPTRLTYRGGPGPFRIAVVIGATLALLGSAVAVLAAPAGSTAALVSDLANGIGGGGDRGGSVVGPITVSAISGSNVSLRTADGWTRTITVTSSTTITKGDETIPLTDLEVGDQVRLTQTENDDGSYTVTAIRVVLPRVGGTVTAKSGANLTLLQRDGTNVTVHTSADTTYRVPGVDNAGLDDITVGMIVVAAGTERSDGSIDASIVAAGFGGRGFHRQGGWWGRDLAPKASASPSASTSTS